MRIPAFARQRPLVICALSYGLGVLAGGLWRGFVWQIPVLGILLSLAAAFLLRKKLGSLFVVSGFAILFLGVLLAGHAANPFLPPEGKYQVNARVTGEARRDEADGRLTLTLADVKVEDDRGIHSVGRAYWSYYPGKDAIIPLDGQIARFEGSLYHPSPQENPYGFDFRMYLLQRGIAVGISGARDLRFDPANVSSPESPWLRARIYLAGQFDSFLGQNSGLAKALIIGVRDDIPEQTNQAFRDAGVAHVLAVSGLHVSLLVGIFYFVLRKFHLSPRALFVIFTALLVIYCRLLDFSASIVRASVLTAVYLLGRTLHRRVDPLTSLSAAFLLILLFRPLDLFNLGFQLSFLAVAGIIILGDCVNVLLAKWSKRHHPPVALVKLAAAYGITFSASAFTALPLISAFHAVSLAGLLISPFAIAGVGVLMVSYLTGLVMSFVHLPLAQMFAWPVVKLTEIYEGIVAWSAGLPFAVWRLPSPSWWQVILVMGLMILVTRYMVLGLRWRQTAGLVIVAILVGVPLVPLQDPVRYIQLSAGTADSALILDGNKTVVIDLGDHGGDLANFILSSGRRIDTLLITHLHADHVSGLEQLLKNDVVIGEICLPSGSLDAELADGSLQWLDAAEAQGIPIRMVGAGDTFSLHRVNGSVIWPHHGAAYPGLAANANSLVTLWDLDGVRLLSMGDISADYSRYLDVEAQVMKLPHHGSRHDATEELIQKVQPELALITASGTQPDRYQEATRRLLGAGAAYAITGETGAVTITCRDGQAEVTGHLDGGLIHGL